MTWWVLVVWIVSTDYRYSVDHWSSWESCTDTAIDMMMLDPDHDTVAYCVKQQEKK